MNRTQHAAAKAAALFLLVLLALVPAMAQQQESADTEMAALQTKIKTLALQKQMDGLEAQKQAIEKRQKALPPPTTTEMEMAAAQARMKVLGLQKQIDALKAQQSALLNPPTMAPTVAAELSTSPRQTKTPLSPEDAEIQRLELERQRLLKEQEIQRLKKGNAELTAPAQPAQPTPQPAAYPPAPAAPAKAPANNCTPQQGSGVSFKAPQKVSAWAAQHFGIVVNDKPAPASGSNACPSDASASSQAAKQ